MTRQIVTAVFSITLLASCNQAAEQQAVDLAADIEAINRLNDEYVAAVNAGDVDGIMMLYTDDAVLMPPNQPALTGKGAIHSYLQGLFDMFSLEEVLSPGEVVVTGDWAFVRATTTVTVTPRAGGEQTQDIGKGIAIYRKEPDGSWKYARLVYNSDNPLPATQ
jgi:uncharacterized protein (TIGR02246 family)